jgi:hypothetical protein
MAMVTLQHPVARANLAAAELEVMQTVSSRFASDVVWLTEQLTAKWQQDDWEQMVRPHCAAP